MRSPVRIAVVVVMIMILGSAFVSRAASPAAQQATPPVGSIGVGGGAVGSGAPIAAPGQLLSLRRGVFEPGGIVPLHHHPGALVIYIESGTLTYTVSAGEAVLTHAAQAGTPAPSGSVQGRQPCFSQEMPFTKRGWCTLLKIGETCQRSSGSRL